MRPPETYDSVLGSKNAAAPMLSVRMAKPVDGSILASSASLASLFMIEAAGCR